VGRAGVKLAFSISQRWGVITPQIRGAFLHEFQAKQDLLKVNFANSPFTDSSGAPALDSGTLIATEVPDPNYMSFGASLAVQLQRGFSGFIGYESLTRLDSISSHELSVGLRYQTHF
jgi:hypothetical protein